MFNREGVLRNQSKWDSKIAFTSPSKEKIHHIRIRFNYIRSSSVLKEDTILGVSLSSSTMNAAFTIFTTESTSELRMKLHVRTLHERSKSVKQSRIIMHFKLITIFILKNLEPDRSIDPFIE